MDRRDLFTVIGAGTALPILATPSVPASPQTAPPLRGPAGTPSDPDLLRPKVTWEKVLTPPELATLAVLCDVIIPADDLSPSASQVGVPAFINEWVSAPYDYQRGALVQLRGGLAWLNAEATRRFGGPFAGLAGGERDAIADDICYEPRAKPEHRAAALVFDLVRDLTATGFYTTREGMSDLRYVGNVPLQKFDGPPPEVLRHLGLA